MNINVDQMLYSDMVWLSRQVLKPRVEFEKIAKQLDFRQEDWDRFWKRVREVKKMTKEANTERFEVIWGNREVEWTLEEINFASFYLGDPEIESNCCGDLITPDGRCSGCKENCGKVYIFADRK